MQIAKLIVYQARFKEDDPAIATTAGVATYGMLMRATASAVDRLEALHLDQKAIVVIDVRNPFHHTVLLIALALCGLASASIQSRNHLALTGVVPELVMTDQADFQSAGSTVVQLGEDWFLVDPARPVDYTRLLGLPGFAVPDAVMRVMFSSGTTGHPKAVALTAGAAEQRLLNGVTLGAGPHSREMRSLNLMGFSTLMGFATPFTTLITGGVVAFASDLQNAIHLIRLFKIELLTAAVFQLNGLLKLLDGKAPLNSIRSVQTGGSRMPRRLLTQTRDKLCPDVIFAYATTEAGMLSMAKSATIDRFPDSAGFLLPWVTMEAVDATGQRVPAGKDGIIRVRTNELARYLNDTTDQIEKFGDGWFYPGDVGHVSEEGVVFVTGRANEVINRGGSIIAPDLIEEMLLILPGVKDAGVFGVVNADGIEEIWAALVADQWVDPNAVRHVVSAKMPDSTPDRVVQIDAIPRNETGKIKRGELREKAIAAK